MVTSGEHGAQPRFYDHAAANRATKMAYILPRIAPFLAPAPAENSKRAGGRPPALSFCLAGPGSAPVADDLHWPARASGGRP